MAFTADWPLAAGMEDVELQSEPPSLQPSPLIISEPLSNSSAFRNTRASELVSMAVPRYHVRTSSLLSNNSIQRSPPPRIIRMNSFDISHGADPFDADPTRNNGKIDDDDVFRVQEPEVESEWQEDLEYEEVDEVSSRSRSNSTSSQKSTNSATVAWSELERAEESEAREEGADEVRCILCTFKASSHGRGRARPFCSQD